MADAGGPSGWHALPGSRCGGAKGCRRPRAGELAPAQRAVEALGAQPCIVQGANGHDASLEIVQDKGAAICLDGQNRVQFAMRQSRRRQSDRARRQPRGTERRLLGQGIVLAVAARGAELPQILT